MTVLMGGSNRRAWWQLFVSCVCFVNVVATRTKQALSIAQFCVVLFLFFVSRDFGVCWLRFLPYPIRLSPFVLFLFRACATFVIVDVLFIFILLSSGFPSGLSCAFTFETMGWIAAMSYE